MKQQAPVAIPLTPARDAETNNLIGTDNHQVLTQHLYKSL